MASIPKDFIEDLIGRTDLVELISPFVTLKRSGKNFTACCPFHDEKSPSFTVSPQKQFYYCFGCGANGNAISFLMDHQRLPFVESIEQLAARAGLSMPSTSAEEQAAQRASHRQRKVLTEHLNHAQQYFSKLLFEKSGRQAQQYLAKRGLTPEIIKRFGLGWAPDEWQHFLKEQPQASYKALEQTGLAISKDGQRFYERFRARIMFPIHNHKGDVIGFGGRVLDDSKPKYLNSPETELFHKQKSLYGWYQFLNSKKRPNFTVLVEGYTDVIALHQAGIEQALATLGTACSEHHLVKIFQQTNTLYFCFDGDSAGQQAALRAMQTVLPHLKDNRQIFFLLLPDGEDPHSLIKEHGAGAFIAQLETAQTLSEFLLNYLTKDRTLSRVDDRAQLVAQAQPLFNKIPPGLYRNLILDELAERTRINSEVLLASLTKKEFKKQTEPAQVSSKISQTQQEPFSTTEHNFHHSQGKYSAHQKTWHQKKTWKKYGARQQSLETLPSSHQLSLTDRLISYLLQNLSQAKLIELPERIRSSSLPEARLLRQLMDQIHHAQDCSLAYLLGYWHNTPTSERLARLAAYSHTLCSKALSDEIADALNALELMALEHDIESALNHPTPDSNKLKSLLTDKARLARTRESEAEITEL